MGQFVGGLRRQPPGRLCQEEPHRALGSAESVEAVLEICERRGVVEFGTVTLAKAIYRLAKTAGGVREHRQKAAALRRHPRVRELIADAVSKIWELHPQGLANTAWAFATLEAARGGSGLLEEGVISPAAVVRIREFAPRVIFIRAPARPSD